MPNPCPTAPRAAAERAAVATCPCGSSAHVIADHPTAHRTGWTPTIGYYDIDDPIAEHRDGEHDAVPDPEACPACPGYSESYG